MYHFNRRTAEPLEPSSALGYDKSTSRCQTTPSIGTLKSYKPVIPSVPFIRLAITFSFSVIGSLWPTFVPVRFVNLSSQASINHYVFEIKILIIIIYLPLHSSVTFQEETAPVKLPTIHCLYKEFYKNLFYIYKKLIHY